MDQMASSDRYISTTHSQKRTLLFLWQYSELFGSVQWESTFLVLLLFSFLIFCFCYLKKEDDRERESCSFNGQEFMTLFSPLKLCIFSISLKQTRCLMLQVGFIWWFNFKQKKTKTGYMPMCILYSLTCERDPYDKGCAVLPCLSLTKNRERHHSPLW